MTDPQANPDPSGQSIEPEPEPTESDLLYQPQEGLGEPEWPSEMPDASPGASSGGSGRTPAGGLIGCTVATRDQLPGARVLRDSFRSSHPGSSFTIVVLDQPDQLGQLERAEYLTPTDIGVEAVEFARLAMGCTADELRAVLRPRLLSWLLESGSTVLYLEPDVQVFGRFDEVLATLTYQQPVALAPRVLRPLHADGLRPSAADLAGSGTFDPNLIAVAPGSEQFLTLWSAQVSADPASAGAFTEGVPALIDHQVLRDPGIGLSVYNAGQRTLDQSDSRRYLVDGCVLRSVHFDRFEPERPWLLSAAYADRPRVLLSEHPLLARLCAGYRNALVASGYPRQQAHPFDRLPDGTLIPRGLRSAYLRSWSEAERTGADVVPSPFEPADGTESLDRFLEWACEPEGGQQRAAGGCRWSGAVWADDPSLQRDHPDPFGVNAEAFREWCAGVGLESKRVPRRAVQPRSEESVTMVDQLGVAVLGAGRLADRVRAAVRASGLPSADTTYYPVVVRCGDRVPVPSGHHLVDVRPDGARDDGSGTGEQAGEIWVLSEASRQAAVRSGGPPARVISLPQPDPGDVDLPTRKGARARLGMSDEYVIGAFVDHADERKGNVLGLVNAFFTAFPDRDDVRMIIAVARADDFPEAAERLRLATTADSRVTLLEGADRDTVVTVASDCVASLHRADGGAGGDLYAMRLLDVASRGIPVVSADHGAAAELLGQYGARLVACQRGGEPDLDAAVTVLAEAAGDPDGTAAFGADAKQHLLTEHSATRAGEALREAVEHAYRSWRAKSGRDRNASDDPLRSLLVARHALHRPPEVGVGVRNAMTPALRKAVLKALGHYDEHIRDIMRSMLDGVEQAAGELLRRQEDAGAGAGPELRGEVERLDQQQDELGAHLSGTDDGILRLRSDLAAQQRSLRQIEERLETGGDERTDALAERIENLTGAVERTLDRVDQLEKQWQDTSRTQQDRIEQGVRRASSDAEHALRATDVVQRVLLREHERNAGWRDDGSSAPVLCDAGLLRLPADDALMLPWLSSHVSWDAEVSNLIDSLLEPGGVFLDVGAYVGYQSIRVLSRLGSTGAVVAVEPSRPGREFLARNVEVNVTNGASDRLTVLDKAAWDSACELDAEAGTAGGLHVRGVRAVDAAGADVPAGEDPVDDQETGTGSDGQTVRGVRLDRELEAHDAVSELGLSVVHVDVGAHVHRILGGLVRLLRRDRPSIVCSFTPAAIERAGDDPAAALREFGTWGYELVPVGRTQAESPETLLAAVGSTGAASTVKLWLRPKGAAE